MTKDLKKPKVLVLGAGLYPVIHFPFYKFQKGIHNLGFEVHVLTTLTHGLGNYEKNLMKKEGKDGVRYHFLDVSWLRGNSTIPLLVSRLMLFFAVIHLNSTHRFQIVHDYSSSPLFIYLGAILKRFLGVYTIHTILTSNMGYLGFLGLGKSVGLIDKCICVTRYQWHLFMQKGCPPEKLVYIPLGIDCERFFVTQNKSFLRKKRKIQEKSTVVLFLSRVLTEQKGAFTLARAIPFILKEYTNTIFIFATLGASFVYDRKHGSHKKKILEILKKHVKEVMIFEGYQNVPQMMAIADIVVLPLTTMYGTLGYPQTLLEAMASGKTIVASNIIGINEVIIGGHNGLLFRIDDHQELTRQVSVFLRNPELRKTFGERARRDVSERLNIKTSIDKVFNIYQQLLKLSN
jgi:glycosyltransferase involved in cell wall biosynthesis